MEKGDRLAGRSLSRRGRRRRTGVKGTESFGLTKRRRNLVNVEESHRGGRLRSSRECDAKEHVPRDRNQVDREVQEWKWFQWTRRREHQELRAAGHVRQDP